jgi:hypothetical protein
MNAFNWAGLCDSSELTIMRGSAIGCGRNSTIKRLGLELKTLQNEERNISSVYG